MFDGFIELVFDILGHEANLIGFLVLALGAALEYVFPPFPGDMVVLMGGVVVAAQGWHPLPVFLAVTLGAMAGAMTTFAAGAWIARHPDSRIGRALRRNPDIERGVARVLAGFDKHGAAYLAINRFLPGIRGFFFLAAGMNGMSTARVLAWGALSAGLWNVLVLVLGVALGGNLERMRVFFERYTAVAWGLLIAALVFFALRVVWRRRRSAGAD